jgi:broad specificity phosphatase PhoE
MSTIYMLRHGQASFGQISYDQLSPIGFRQARCVAAHLQAIGISFDAVYTGKLARQRQTAQTLAEVFADFGTPMPPPREMADLNEYDAAGIWQRYYPQLVREHPELTTDTPRIAEHPKRFQKTLIRLVHQWAADHDTSPGLESWPAFRARVGNGLETIMRHEGAGKNLVLCSSAGPIAVAVQRATAMPDDRCIDLSWQVWNASLTKFRYNTEKMTLVGFNDIAALQMKADPALLSYR